MIRWMSDAGRIGTLEYQVHELQQQVKGLTKRVAELERCLPGGSSGGSEKPMRTVIATKMNGPRRR